MNDFDVKYQLEQQRMEIENKMKTENIQKMAEILRQKEEEMKTKLESRLNEQKVQLENQH